MSTCRLYLKACVLNAPEAAAAMKGAAVLGDASGYTVELRDGSQLYVGRVHCKYCARAEALSKIATRLEEGLPLCDYAKSKEQRT